MLNLIHAAVRVFLDVLVVAIVVTTPLVLVVAALALVECLLRMVSGALTRLGISILRTLS